MKKRGQALGLRTIVIAILAIIVLFLIIILFNSQIKKSAKQYTDIGDQAAQEGDLNSCKSGLFNVRQCSSGEPSKDYYWRDIGSLDCKSGKCWERGEPRPKK